MSQPAGSAPAMGERFGRFRVLGLLGKGGMGAVYRARDEQLGRPVALKVLLTLDDPALRERFAREARSVAALRHPGIVALLDAGEERGVPWLAMELVEGETLSHALERGRPGSSDAALVKPLEPREAARIVAEVARGLEHAHAHGIVHRDLKPANVLLERDGRARVADFGLARAAGEAARGLSASGQIVGTPAYMSPEQASGEPATEVSDVYGAGAVLYEALTGRPPHEGPTPANILFSVIQKEPPAPRSLDARVHLDLETICQKALEKEPARRYASAADLAADLERFLRGEPIEARPPGALERLGRSARRHPGAVATVAVLLPLAIGGGLWFVHFSRAERLLAEAKAHREEQERQARRAAFIARFADQTVAATLRDEAARELARDPPAAELESLSVPAREREILLRERHLTACQRLCEDRALETLGADMALIHEIHEDAVRLLELDGPRPRWRFLACFGGREDRRQLEELAGKDRDGPWGLMAGALLAGERNDVARASELATRSVERAPEAVELQVMALQFYVLEDRLDTAIAELESIVSHKPRPRSRYAEVKLEVLRHQRDGRARRARGDLVGALADFESMLERAPRSPNARSEIALVHEQQGRHEEALAELDSLIAAGYDVAHLLPRRANVHLHLEHFAQALADYERTRTLGVRDAMLEHNRAGVLLKLGRNREALAASDEAIALAGADTRAHYDFRIRKVVALARLGRTDDATAECRSLIETRGLPPDERARAVSVLEAIQKGKLPGQPAPSPTPGR